MGIGPSSATGGSMGGARRAVENLKRRFVRSRHAVAKITRRQDRLPLGGYLG